MTELKLRTQKRQHIIEGGPILSMALVVIKMLGWVFRFVSIRHIYGSTGNGYFVTVNKVYTTIYSLIVLGAPAAISHLVAQYTSQGRYRDVCNLEKPSLRFFAFIGLVGGYVRSVFSGRTLLSFFENIDRRLSILHLRYLGYYTLHLFLSALILKENYWNGIADYREVVLES